MLGTNVRVASLEGLLDECTSAITARNKQIFFACANVHSVILARTDEQFAGALRDVTQLVADGIGVVIAARLVCATSLSRVTGAQYFFALTRRIAKQRGRKVFFLGSSQETLLGIAHRFRMQFPSIEVCGTYSPPFGSWSPEENEKIISVINRARPDVLWVGMTAPKQEKWIHENRGRVDASVIGAIGAVFDFFAGTKKRAPAWMCKIGAEWIFRLVYEPRRLWRRHFISIPAFVALVLLAAARNMFTRKT